jgi:Holliday junction resolvase RusA-like endonuclease
MRELRFALPWSALVSDNRRYGRGHILSRQYRQARTEVAGFCNMAALKARWRKTDAIVHLEVEVIEPDRRRRDLNFSKALKDSISYSSVIWDDDSQVRSETWRFVGRDKATAGATVLIRILDPDK